MDLKSSGLSKMRIIGPAILAVGLLGGIALAWLLFGQDRSPERKENAPRPAYRMQIEGLKFHGMNQGRRVIAIAADRFTVGKGKLGFFSTGLTRTVRMENARIDIYALPPSDRESAPEQPSAGPLAGTASTAHEPIGTPPAGVTSAGGGVNKPLANRPMPPDDGSGNAAPPGKGAASSAKKGGIPEPGTWNFGDLFAEETFSSLLPAKNIAAIEAAPVVVQLHGERGVMTRIAAASASIRRKDREIRFAGGVQVASGGAELTTEQLTFLPRTATFRIDKPFVLKKGSRTLEGAGLTTDLFLGPL